MDRAEYGSLDLYYMEMDQFRLEHFLSDSNLSDPLFDRSSRTLQNQTIESVLPNTNNLSPPRKLDVTDEPASAKSKKILAMDNFSGNLICLTKECLLGIELRSRVITYSHDVIRRFTFSIRRYLRCSSKRLH